MMSTKTIIKTLAVFLIAGCSTSKPTTNQSSKPNTVAENKGPAKSADGIYAPGNEELTVIQNRNPNVTMEHLTEGYTLYTKGACVNCHASFPIYQFGETKWKKIVNEMAVKAQISDAQKAAVYAYVISIKANQPK